VERYFMTTSEAAQLVIKASLFGTNERLYVLKMGEQRKIIDIARDMIRLSGLEEDKDIKFVITGLRTGEKLSEKLFNAWEERELMKDSLIYEAVSKIQIDCTSILNRIERLANQYSEISKQESKPVNSRELLCSRVSVISPGGFFFLHNPRRYHLPSR
ncbi:MAG: polysaccharide biosynthesis protein, partial [Bacteroidales bacterium]|nr:polysaccharide biosynthesis protein [Bacteroidales bacterium]